MHDLTPVPLTIGTLAYLDTLPAMVPCKVTAVGEPEQYSSVPTITITLTATRGAYTRGETLTRRADHVVPRTCTYYRNGIMRIRNTWHVVKGDGARVDIFG